MVRVLGLDLLLLAILQGITELFPISSLGHSVLVPALFHWPMDRDAPWFLPYIVVLHLGTAAALFMYFWRDWLSSPGWRLDGARQHRATPRRVSSGCWSAAPFPRPPGPAAGT